MALPSCYPNNLSLLFSHQQLHLIFLVLLLDGWLITSHASVVTLTTENFDQNINSEDTRRWIVEFYAPWCPHCQKLKPLLEEAAALIDKEARDSQLHFGLIDCTVEKDLASRFEVQGYPTLKYSSAGKMIDFNGGRQPSDFLDFAKKLLKPVITNISRPSEMKSFLNTHLVAFIAVDEAYLPILSEFAELWRIYDHLGFAYLEENALLYDYLNFDSPALILYNDNPIDHFETFEGFPSAQTEAYDWMTERAFPLLNEFDFNNWRLLTKSKITVIAVVEKEKKESEDHSLYLDTLKTVAAEYKSTFTFGWFDTTKHERFISQFELSDFPALVAFDVPNDIFYTNESLRFNKATLQKDMKTFLEAVIAGQLPPQGGGSGIIGKLKQIGNTLYWQFVDHPFLLGSLLVFFLLICGLVAFIGTSDFGEDEELSKKKA